MLKGDFCMNKKKLSAMILAAGLLFVGCGNSPQERESAASDAAVETSETEAPESVSAEVTAEELKEGCVLICGQQYDTSLTELYLCATFFNDEDAAALQKMVNLTRLHLSELNTPDISFLTELHGLKTLIIYFAGTKDYTALKDVPDLETLRIRSSGIGDYSQFSILADTNITSLDLGEGSSDDLTPLSGLTNLKELYLDHSSLPDDLSPLSSLTELKTLDISYSNVSDITPLSGLTDLEVLCIGTTEVSDISPVSSLTELKTLGIEYTNVSDLSPLSGLTKLEALDISHTNVSDISVLYNMTELKTLYWGESQVSEEDIEALRQALPSCAIKWDYWDYFPAN